LEGIKFFYISLAKTKMQWSNNQEAQFFAIVQFLLEHSFSNTYSTIHRDRYIKESIVMIKKFTVVITFHHNRPSWLQNNLCDCWQHQIYYTKIPRKLFTKMWLALTSRPLDASPSHDGNSLGSWSNSYGWSQHRVHSQSVCSRQSPIRVLNLNI
jgi:hypothetical protein